MKVLLVANSSWNLWHYRLPLIQALAEAGYTVQLVCPPGPYSRRLRHLGYTVHDWAMSRRGLGPFDNLQASMKLQRLYERERPDIVHHFTIKANLLGGLAAHRAGMPGIINNWTGLGYVFSDALAPRLLRPTLRWLLRASHEAATTICQTAEDAETLAHYGIVGTTVIPGTGVDLVKFHPTTKHNPRPVVLMASRLLKSKGIFNFAAAAKVLGNKADFVLAGEPDPGNPGSISQDEYKQLSRRLACVGQVANMTNLFSLADIAVLPTSYNEGIPLFLQEATACGLPVVASDLPGCRAVVQHGLNGRTIPCQDTQALNLIDALTDLINDPELRARYGECSRTVAENFFGQETIIRRYLMVYGLFNAWSEESAPT